VDLRIVDPDQQPISEHIVIAVAQVSPPSERQPEAARIPEVVSEMRDIATASDIERVIVTSLEDILVTIEDLDRCVTCDVRGQGHAKGAPSLGPFLTGSTSSVATPGRVKIKGRVEIDPLRVAREITRCSGSHGVVRS
jgi:hypothetical protein